MSRFLIKCGLHTLAIVGLPTITTNPVLGAERVSLSFGPLEFSVSINSLETYAEDGIADSNLATHIRGLAPDESDTPSEAGGLMSVTASKAGVLARSYLFNR